MNFKLLKSFSLTAALLATTNLCFAMDPSPDSSESSPKSPKTQKQRKSLGLEDQEILNPTHPLSPEEEAILNQYKEKNLNSGLKAIYEHVKKPENAGNPLTPLLMKIFKEVPDAIKHFAEELLYMDLRQELGVTSETFFELQRSGFDALRLNSLKGIIPLDTKTLYTLATCCQIHSMRMLNLKYNSLALFWTEKEMGYYILAVKHKDNKKTILKLLKRIQPSQYRFEEDPLEQDCYPAFFSVLFSDLSAGDLVRQKLFNKVCYEQPEAFLWINKRTNDLKSSKDNSDLVCCLQQTITQFISASEVQEKKKREKILNLDDQKILNSMPSFSQKEIEQIVRNNYKKNFDNGFKALRAYMHAPESTIASLTSLLREIFNEYPEAIPRCYELWRHRLARGKTRNTPKIFFSFLNALRLNRLNGIIPKLDLQTIANLAHQNWEASEELFYSLNEPDKKSYMEEPDKKSYMEEAVWYSILGAKEGNNLVFNRLLNIIDGTMDGKLNGKKEHPLFFTILIPSLKEDPKSKKLFIEVCLQSEGAVKCIQKHVTKLEENKNDSQQLACLKGLIADFKQKKQEQERKEKEKKQEEERKEKGKKAYENAITMWTINPHGAIAALREAVECDYLEAQKKLEEIRKSKGFSAKNYSKNDHGAILKKIETEKGKQHYEYVERFLKRAAPKNAQISKEETTKALIALSKAVALGNQKAKEQEKKIKNSQGYKDAENHIDKEYTDPLSKLGKKYYENEILHAVGKKSQAQLPQPAPSLPAQSSTPAVPEKPSVENPKEVFTIERSETHAKIIEQKQSTTALPQETRTSLEKTVPTPIIIVPVNAKGEATTEVPLPNSNPQEPKKKIEEAALTTEVPISTDVPLTESSSPNQVSDSVPEKKKTRVNKILEPSKKKKKQLAQTNSKGNLSSLSSHSGESSSEDFRSSARDKPSLPRTVSLHNLKKPESGPTPKIERRKSLSQLEVPPHFRETTKAQKEKKSNTPSTKMNFKELLKRRESKKNSERLKTQKEQEKVSHATGAGTSPEVSYKKLLRALSKCERQSDVKLSEKTITETLKDLEKNNVATWIKNGNTISATKIGDPTVHLTLHTHSDSDKKWFEKPECVAHFLWFARECSPGLAEAINNIGK